MGQGTQLAAENNTEHARLIDDLKDQLLKRLSEIFALVRGEILSMRECKAGDCRRLFLQKRCHQEYCCRAHQWKQAQRNHKGIPSERHGKHGPKPRRRT